MSVSPATWGIAAAVLGGAWLLLRLAGRGDIRGAEARALVAGGARLVDVRTPREYAAGHMPGAVNMPLDALERRLGELGARERPVVVYCASGTRSAAAQRTLRRHGFGSVRNLGSWRTWSDDSGRTEGGSR